MYLNGTSLQVGVRYIHELSLTLEHSMPMSSPTAPGLTDLPQKMKTLEASLRKDDKPWARKDGESRIAIG